MSNRTFQRTSRVSAQLRKLIAELVDREVKDPRVDAVTITDVEVTGDLREARVYFSHPGDERQDREVMAGLTRASGFIRREMGRRIQMRVTPSIEFRIDRSLAYGARIEKIFKDLNEAESSDGSSREE
ncbi:MAG: 30S ribosome-binding factor RbfA [Myxococcota bacterium]|nr:30S ribosome-binding factor RbfA [Myxococcota bacterium]